MRAGELATRPCLLLFWNAKCIYCPVDPSSSQEVIFSRARGDWRVISPENSTPPVRTLGIKGPWLKRPLEKRGT